MSTRRLSRLLAACPVLLALGLAGCASSTVETRKQERYGAYSALAPELRAQVDSGKIKVGMTEDAVYIAFGKPDQILQEENAAGATTRWLYRGTHLEEYRHWNHRPYHVGRHYLSEPVYTVDYYPRPYVRTEVVFRNGVVSEWRTLPTP
jgi:hypothetical protein